MSLLKILSKGMTWFFLVVKESLSDVWKIDYKEEGSRETT